MKFRIHTKTETLLTDTFTPVSIYLRLRDKFPNSILLESSDYHGSENSYSFICCEPIATIKVENEKITESFPDDSIISTAILENKSVANAVTDFAKKFDVAETGSTLMGNGLFGYTTYDAVRYFEKINMDSQKERGHIPDLQYSLYRFVIAIDHFKEQAILLENSVDGHSSEVSLEQLASIIVSRNVAQFGFALEGDEESNLTNEEYLAMVRKGKEECSRGNVFQVVLSREFTQSFKGDDFNVYRALRSVNPSPYLFYFDYGSFKIFGSSPEAQLVIKNGEAQIHPIAGTFPRTGDASLDQEQAAKLREDKKETAEHVMLVDLARNDLSRSCENVNVEVFSETQFYSHVIHLVSKVTGKIKKGITSLRVFEDTFPAGTLSGAPKVRAMQIISDCEKNRRGYYGGAIGFIGFNGDLNHAIIIRSFLSKDNCLYYRAGAGVVIASREENELQEVNNKLAALKRAMEMAEKI